MLSYDFPCFKERSTGEGKASVLECIVFNKLGANGHFGSAE